MTASTREQLSRDEHAASWCLRLAEDKLTMEDRRALDSWLVDADNRKAFELAVSLWRHLDVAAEQPEVIRLRTQALEDFRLANSQRWARSLPIAWRWASLAAGLVAVAVIAIVLSVRSDAQDIRTGIGERRVVTLAEGSQISLDAETKVKVRLTEDRRQIELLAGRARFDVAKDPLRPFSVTVGDKVVVATGTSFSVERLQQQVRVVLYEGRVEILPSRAASSKATATSNKTVVLVPGRELIASVSGSVTDTVAVTDVSRSISWESGQLNFIDEPLGSAVERVNRYTERKLDVADAYTAEMRLNGVFNAGDNAAFLEAVRSLLPVDIVETQDHVTLKGRPPRVPN